MLKNIVVLRGNVTVCVLRLTFLKSRVGATMMTVGDLPDFMNHFLEIVRCFPSFFFFVKLTNGAVFVFVLTSCDILEMCDCTFALIYL